MRFCEHLTDEKRSAFEEKKTWKAGERTIVEDECRRCGRVRRYDATKPGDELALSGRRVRRAA